MTGLAYPILIYDNRCYSCTKYAKIVNDIVKNRCVIVGHYTIPGKEIKEQLFPKGYEGLEMSWFIIDGYAHGGRAGLFRLLKYIILGRKKGKYPKNEFSLAECTTDCKTVKGIFLRSSSLVTMYKKFSVPQK